MEKCLKKYIQTKNFLKQKYAFFPEFCHLFSKITIYLSKLVRNAVSPILSSLLEAKSFQKILFLFLSNRFLFRTHIFDQSQGFVFNFLPIFIFFCRSFFYAYFVYVYCVSRSIDFGEVTCVFFSTSV